MSYPETADRGRSVLREGRLDRGDLAEQSRAEVVAVAQVDLDRLAQVEQRRVEQGVVAVAQHEVEGAGQVEVGLDVQAQDLVGQVGRQRHAGDADLEARGEDGVLMTAIPCRSPAAGTG